MMYCRMQNFKTCYTGKIRYKIVRPNIPLVIDVIWDVAESYRIYISTSFKYNVPIEVILLPRVTEVGIVNPSNAELPTF